MEKKEADDSQTQPENSSSDNLAKQIEAAAENLSYMSETDAEIELFRGKTMPTLDKARLLAQIGGKTDSPVEEKDFADFFARLTEIQDWYGDEEKEATRKFARLREVLQANLRELKVFKVGKVDLDIYAVGLDENDVLLGIVTKAVETGD